MELTSGFSKKDGSVRLCVDYRQLNGESESDAYPMPRIDEVIDKLGKSSFISTIDLTRILAGTCGQGRSS